ncbi:MAG: DNA-processing protein DprA [Candidatus Eremiobacteraeota bacterium]|nr:DNA-processing protein DprA [Candidatus Eremiobacteraeota bacterium]
MEVRYVGWPEIRACRKEGSPGIPDAAEGLYVSGSLEGLERSCVAIVGTRAASRNGQSLTHRIAADLARAGVCVISGLALGIDGAAHAGALEAGGPTIGILGSGHRCFFPRRNHGLGEQMIAAGGAVCSPYSPDRPALPHQFIERNAVVAALADAVVVVEAPSRSGALNTAAWAAGRIPVLVFPGDVDRTKVAGCLALIRDGATLVRNSRDILEELRLPASREQLDLPLAAHEVHDPMQRAILVALSDDVLSEDELIEHLKCKAAALLAALTELELTGAIERRDAGRFARR